jgi:protein SCO1/2
MRRTIALIVCVAAMALWTTGCGGSSSTAATAPTPTATVTSGSAGPGTTVRIRVPDALRHLPLVNQDGKTVDLASWPGKTVLLVPFLSLCQDVCPLITGNLVVAEQSLRDDRAASKVRIVELTVDPGRDTPARLAAYAKLTDATWQLVTEPAAELRRLAKFFGFTYQKVPEGEPGARDWWTGKPLTYDVDHSDNYFVIDPSGTERVVQDAAPDFHGKLNPKLNNFLDGLGRLHLVQPAQPNWTPTDLLRALAVSVGTSLPPSPVS